MSNQPHSPSREVAGFSKSEMRIDLPHAINRGAVHQTAERSAVELVGAAIEERAQAAGIGVEHSLEQLREHAAQLADRLQSEQTELDRRQSALAAQEADLDAKWQNARQWLDERQQEIDARAEIVAQREQELAEREAAAESRAKELTQVRE